MSDTRSTINKSVLLASALSGGFIAYRTYQKYAKIPSKKWITECPKIELHAHLHGSIRMKTLAELYQNAVNDNKLKNTIDENANPHARIQSILKAHKTFNEVFALFGVIHKIVTSKSVLVRIVNEVLLDFAKQNVKYLELRSTPRALEDSKHSRKDYVDIILEQIRLFPTKYPKHSDMHIRLILTMQNAKPLSEAEETLQIIQNYLDSNTDKESLIVGIDFAPRNYANRTFKHYENVLNKARRMGMKITIHFAEYYDRNEQNLVLRFKPDRLGHAVNLKEEDYVFLMNNPIPIEMCPTSNILTKSIKNYSDHPYGRIQERFCKKGDNRYPMLFCTDDMGVFEIDLNHEWEQMCNAHYLTRSDVKRITYDAVNFIFASDETKKEVLSLLRKDWKD